MTAALHRPATRSRPALVAIASIVTVAFMGSVIVTPLYSLFQAKFGFSEITLTLVYAVYVLGNIVALLVFGQVSDQIGRRRVAIPALLLAALSAVLFLIASGTAFLYLGRIVIGLAVGVASGTGTAWLADELGPDRRAVATVAAAVANLAGIAVGPLLGGLLAQYGPWPLHLSFVVYIGLLAAVAGTVALVPETARPRVRRLGDVRVHLRIGVPRELLRAFAPLAVTGFVTFALGGVYFALIPGIVLRDLHYGNVAISGALVFEFGTIAATLIVLGRRLAPALAMRLGLVALLPAVALVVVAQAVGSLPVLVVAAALGGVTLAFGYRGSLQLVNDLAPDDRRAEVVSSYYMACFVGNAVPVIGIGVLSTVAEPLTGSIVFAGIVAALSLGALTFSRAAAARS